MFNNTISQDKSIIQKNQALQRIMGDASDTNTVTSTSTETETVSNFIDRLRKFDVVCSQSVKTAIPENEGNARFAEMINANALEYHTFTKRAEKRDFTTRCIHSMQQRYQTRFVKGKMVVEGCQCYLRYEELTLAQARDKVSHAFRFAYKKMMKQSR